MRRAHLKLALPLGIILLGFKLNLTVLFTQVSNSSADAAVVLLTVVVCYNIARKLGGVSCARHSRGGRYRHLWRGGTSA